MSLESVRTAVETGKVKKIEGLVQGALDEGCAAAEVLDAMIGVMDDIGDKFQRNEIFVPEMLVSALAMKKGVAVLKPHLGAGEAIGHGKFIIGTVKGDLHDIGKNLVAMMVESAGFEVIDLGVDVPAGNFIAALRENPDCRLVGLSALLTTTMDNMKATAAAIRSEFPSVKIMVGGAPITPEFAQSIGADAYTADAGSAASKAKELAD
jgi:methanogenic corrinoid protein MtbC1